MLPIPLNKGQSRKSSLIASLHKVRDKEGEREPDDGNTSYIDSQYMYIIVPSHKQLHTIGEHTVISFVSEGTQTQYVQVLVQSTCFTTSEQLKLALDRKLVSLNSK